MVSRKEVILVWLQAGCWDRQGAGTNGLEGWVGGSSHGHESTPTPRRHPPTHTYHPPVHGEASHGHDAAQRQLEGQLLALACSMW